MIVALLLAVGLYLVAGPQLVAWVQSAAASANLPQLDRRHVGGAALIAAAAFLWVSSRPEAAPEPAPTPAPDAALDLRGTFVGPDAAADAATVAALMGEFAAEIEWDAMQAEPFLKTGVATDELRVRAFDLRCRGVSLGAKHPRARDAIRTYLDAAAGTAGGPLSPSQRSAWIAAYREVAKAAEAAIR